MKSHPEFLYGTAWKEEDTERCVRDALAAGFRAFDTANQRKHYFEAGVGAALKIAIDKGTVKPEDLFLQTKFTFMRGQDQRLPYDPDASITQQVQQSFQSSLEHLHVSDLDSYILHGPSQRNGLGPNDWEAWRAMEELYNSGSVKAIGISNVNVGQLQELWAKARVKPAYVQNRCYARMGWDAEVRKFCHDNGVIYQGFSLLTANPQVFQQPFFGEMKKRLKATSAQLVFRFVKQIGIVPLTGTTNPDHMKEDLDYAGEPLTPEDLEKLEYGFLVQL